MHWAWSWEHANLTSTPWSDSTGFLFCREAGFAEKLSYLPRMTQLISRRGRIQTWAWRPSRGTGCIVRNMGKELSRHSMDASSASLRLSQKGEIRLRGHLPAPPSLSGSCQGLRRGGGQWLCRMGGPKEQPLFSLDLIKAIP